MADSARPVSELLSRLTWLKHASFLYDGSARIAFDPWDLTLDHGVDLVLVTHGHDDHCDPKTISRILREGATVVAAEACADRISGNVLTVKTGDIARVGAVTVTAVPAYNLTKRFHPLGEGVGFLVAVDGGTIFHAGDTDDIPETHGLAPDIALLPVGGTYTMDVAEAARAAAAIGASCTVPMHYGYIVGSKEDGSRFQEQAAVAVQTLSPTEPFLT